MRESTYLGRDRRDTSSDRDRECALIFYDLVNIVTMYPENTMRGEGEEKRQDRRGANE